MRVRLLTAIGLAITLSACFSAKPIAPSAIPPPTASTSQAIFPHKPDWKDPAQHGVYVKDTLGMDTTTCLGCHKDGNLSGGAPSCYSCHTVFPHSDPGLTKNTHGPYVVKFGKSACATQCHGSDLKGGLSGVACTQCHTVYPHADAWSTPGVHGPMAKGDLKNNCTLCHGADWTGGNSKISCVDCHKGIYPHAINWSSPDQHGAFVQTNGTGKCATQCHGVQLDGGLSGIGCKTCHAVWPHPASGWMAAHGDTARSIGINGCLGCHKNDATGGDTGISCAKCHAPLPLHIDATWSKSGHGQFVIQNPTALTTTDPKETKRCSLCHGADLSGGKPPTLPGLTALKGCKDCHASYPAQHKPAAGAPAWNTYNGHSKWVLNQVVIGKDTVSNQITKLIAECKLCHGDDLKGGTTGKTCFKSGCHLTFPHNSDPTLTPWVSKHGAVASAETQSGAAKLSCATANCHGIDQKGLPAGEKDVSKKLTPGCTDCHMQVPHQPLGQWDHGKSVVTPGGLLDVTQCAKCHGSNWTGGNLGPTCYQCHANFPLPHRQTDGSTNVYWGQKAQDGKTMPDHSSYALDPQGGDTKTVGATGCKTCHGNDLLGGVAGVSCYKCHATFPHPAAAIADWKTGHKDFITQLVANAAKPTTAFAVITSECAPCHISAGKNDCATCHHQNVPNWATKDQHGAKAIANIAGCKSCHGPDLKSGTLTNGKMCTTCHGPGMKATMSSHQDIVTTTTGVSFDQCCDNCIDSNDWNDPTACTDCASGYYNCGDPKPWTNVSTNYFVKSENFKVGKQDGTTIHMTLAKQNLGTCQICHGDNLHGGVSGKTCFVQGSCHDPGNRYKDHTTDQKTQWLQLIANKQVEYWSTLITNNTPKYPAGTYGGMTNCETACHRTLYPALFGNPTFDLVNGTCTDCHKGNKPPP